MKLTTVVAIAALVVILCSMMVYDHSTQGKPQTDFEKISIRGDNPFFTFDSPKMAIDANPDNGTKSGAAAGSSLSASPAKLTTNQQTLLVINPSTIDAVKKPVEVMDASSVTPRLSPTEPIAQIIPTRAFLERNQSCRETIDLKCDMHPYVKFWNRRLYEEDCYKSPLMHPLGLLGPVEEQKYVVFQPDGGGWNNIRMAAEVAMIFAHVTGRYSSFLEKLNQHAINKS